MKAVVLLSGGLDSATVLGLVTLRGYEVYALSFRYGQRHAQELERAQVLAVRYRVAQHVIIDLDLKSFGGSSLLGCGEIPQIPTEGIPSTYVPGRNLIFLSVAVSWAEAIGAHDVFLGINAVDYSGYPDCRPAFLEAFQRVVDVGTKVGQEGDGISLHAPLLHLSKAEIVKKADWLGLDPEETLSCYQPDVVGSPCGVCDACRLRNQGLIEAGIGEHSA